ncbi:hypothetical protein TELCIR_04942 [Teladorsagia circumcincta]|uniref:Unspecific monooxygenase n=1 Tax=Teladorsagia circumcincta TaxID=45464 RepID=A0A2G9US90_TELCI|nr:hypothetical protein TELCIR_04942 [Teladorsagia circumcincta]
MHYVVESVRKEMHRQKQTSAEFFEPEKGSLWRKFCVDVNDLGPPIQAAHTDFTYQMEDWGRRYVLGEECYYGLLKLWVGPVPVVFCGMPESIRPILESHTNVSKPNQYDIVSEWIGTGLLTSTNEKWHRRRKMLTPTFHFNILQGYHNVFVQHGEILVDLIAKEEGFFDLFPYLKRCALDIICGKQT